MSSNDRSATRPDEIHGGCLCGAIRYCTTEAPIGGFFCHCRMCQKGYGNLFQPTVQFKGSTFAFIQGTPKVYPSTEFARRHFCQDCGSPILFSYVGNRDVWVLVGTLDRPQDWPLTRDAAWGVIQHVHIESKISWVAIDESLPQTTGQTTPLRDVAIMQVRALSR